LGPLRRTEGRGRDEKGGKEGTREWREREWMEEGRGKVTGNGRYRQDMGCLSVEQLLYQLAEAAAP